MACWTYLPHISLPFALQRLPKLRGPLDCHNCGTSYMQPNSKMLCSVPRRQRLSKRLNLVICSNDGPLRCHRNKSWKTRRGPGTSEPPMLGRDHGCQKRNRSRAPGVCNVWWVLPSPRLTPDRSWSHRYPFWLLSQHLADIQTSSEHGQVRSK